jgi:hypothetical protein
VCMQSHFNVFIFIETMSNSEDTLHPDVDVEIEECSYKGRCTCKKCLKIFYDEMEDHMQRWEDEKLKWESYMKTCSCRNVPAREECMPDCIVLEQYNKHIRNKPIQYGHVLY